MKILWVSNTPIGPAAMILGLSYNGSSGGWIESEYEKIDAKQNRFVFLCTSRDVKKGEVVVKTSSSGKAYCLHSPRLCYGIKNPKYLEKEISKIISIEEPDIIQIWGTETCVSNIVANVETACPKFVFIQGLLGIHRKYLGGHFSRESFGKDYVHPSLFDLLKEKVRQKGFIKQVPIEKDTILKCGNVICDGNMVKAYCSSLGEKISFYEYKLFPNNVFLRKKWDYQNCIRFSIFTIFSPGPEKGLHQLLKALCIVKKAFPGVMLKVPGPYPIDAEGHLIPKTFYEKNINSFLKRNDIYENVVFVGKLSPSEMSDELLKANCFVNPSIMEVHALSLREALVCGTPSVSSVCGSVLDFAVHGKNCFLYRFDEYEVLADHIKKILSKQTKSFDQSAFCFSDGADLMKIYRTFIK